MEMQNIQQPQGMMEMIMMGNRPILYIFVSLMIMWLGIILGNIGLVLQSNSTIMFIIGAIFYSFGLMILSFFLIGMAIIRNDFDRLIRIFLIIAMISVMYLGFSYFSYIHL